MRKFRPFLYIPFLTFILLIACTEETEKDKDLAPTPGTISINESTVKPYQVVEVQIDSDLNAATYQGSFGKENITLHKNTDTSLVFMVPASSISGIHPLTLKVDGKSYQTEVNVVEVQQINDADSYVNDYVKEYLQDTEGLFAGIDKSELEKAKADFDALSEEEKAVAANFFAANSAVLDQLQKEIEFYEGMNEKRAGQCDIQCHVAQFVKILAFGVGAASVGGTAGLAIALVGGIEVGLSLITGKRSILIMKIKEGVKGLFNKAQIPLNQLSNTTLDFEDSKFSNFRTASTKPVFENNEAITFSIKLSYRTLNQEDVNSDESIIADFIKLYNKLREAFPKTDFPSFNDKVEQVYTDNLNHFSVKVYNNDNVKASTLTGSAEKFFVKFSTQEKEEQNFTFTINYNDGKNPAQQIVQKATLLGQKPIARILTENGPWLREFQIYECFHREFFTFFADGSIKYHFESECGKKSFTSDAILKYHITTLPGEQYKIFIYEPNEAADFGMMITDYDENSFTLSDDYDIHKYYSQK